MGLYLILLSPSAKSVEIGALLETTVAILLCGWCPGTPVQKTVDGPVDLFRNLYGDLTTHDTGSFYNQ